MLFHPIVHEKGDLEENGTHSLGYSSCESSKYILREEVGDDELASGGQDKPYRHNARRLYGPLFTS